MKNQWIQTIIIVAANLLLWIIPSNVSYLIAQNRDVLLGRYGLTHLTWAIFLIPVSLLWLYLIWSNEKNVRKRQFQVITLVLSIIIPIVVVDLFMRLAQPKAYVMKEDLYHRTPNSVFTGTIQDIPENSFSYPQMRPGYPDIEFTLTTDKTGFRNKTELKKYDIIALGDSFTEGSNVTDEDMWTVKLSQKCRLSVYNLGMAGTHPGIYKEILTHFGIELSPKVALCMLYEGNDFRDSNYEKEDSISHKISNYFRASPLRGAVRTLLINKLTGAANTNSESQDVSAANSVESEKECDNTASVSALSWLPVPVPNGPDAKYYTFTVKSLCAHFVKKDTFLHTKGCKQTIAYLRQIKKICDDNHIHLIIVYAPDKSHVLMPLICENLSPETLREFMALRESKLPSADKIKDEVLSRLEIEEQMFKEFCQKESIGFVSLTDSLRHNIALGEQLYFTYDDHWTPIGHEVVANTISNFINELPEFKMELKAKADNPG